MVGDDAKLEFDIVVHEVIGEAVEELSRAVADIPDGAIDGEGGLGGGFAIACETGAGGEGNGGGDAFEGEFAVDLEVLRAGGCVGEWFAFFDYEAGFGEVFDVEEIVAFEMVDEEVVMGIAFQVVAGDGVHIEDEVTGGEVFVGESEGAGFEGDVAPVFIDEVTAEPFDAAFVEIDGEGAVGDRGCA